MGVRHWLLARLPAGLVVHPAEWWLAVTLFLSGLVIVIGLGTPVSVARLLWHPVYFAWGVCLIVGSTALMSGLSSIQWAAGTDLYTIKRIPAYRLGLRLLGLASVAYAVAIAIVGGWDASVAVALTLAFAAMCFIRLLGLGRDK